VNTRKLVIPGFLRPPIVGVAEVTSENVLSGGFYTRFLKLDVPDSPISFVHQFLILAPRSLRVRWNF